MALTCSLDRTIHLWDCSKGVSNGIMTSTSSIYSLDISVSDSSITSGHGDGLIRIWSIREKK